MNAADITDKLGLHSLRQRNWSDPESQPFILCFFPLRVWEFPGGLCPLDYSPCRTPPFLSMFRSDDATCIGVTVLLPLHILGT